MRIPHTPLKPRDAALWFAMACRRSIRTARNRDELEAAIALARYATGVPANLGVESIERWWAEELRYRARAAIATFARMRAKHRRPAAAKTRPARPVFKHAR